MTETKARTCAAPGCNAALGRENQSGVCRHHKHAKPYCKCAQCSTGPRHEYRETVAARPDVRTVLVPNVGMYSGIDKTTRVSLPRMPWEARQ